MTPQTRQRHAIHAINRLGELADCALNDDTYYDLVNDVQAIQELLRAANITTILLDHLSRITEKANVANRLGNNDMYDEVLP